MDSKIGGIERDFSCKQWILDGGLQTNRIGMLCVAWPVSISVHSCGIERF